MFHELFADKEGIQMFGIFELYSYQAHIFIMSFTLENIVSDWENSYKLGKV